MCFTLAKSKQISFTIYHNILIKLEGHHPTPAPNRPLNVSAHLAEIAWKVATFRNFNWRKLPLSWWIEIVRVLCTFSYCICQKCAKTYLGTYKVKKLGEKNPDHCFKWELLLGGESMRNMRSGPRTGGDEKGTQGYHNSSSWSWGYVSPKKFLLAPLAEFVIQFLQFCE